jgi:hypothetical protein
LDPAPLSLSLPARLFGISWRIYRYQFKVNLPLSLGKWSPDLSRMSLRITACGLFSVCHIQFLILFAIWHHIVSHSTANTSQNFQVIPVTIPQKMTIFININQDHIYPKSIPREIPWLPGVPWLAPGPSSPHQRPWWHRPAPFDSPPRRRCGAGRCGAVRRRCLGFFSPEDERNMMTIIYDR